MWGTDKKELHYKAHIKIHAEDRPGILADIASIFTKSNLNIVNIQSRDIDAMIIEFVVEVEVLNTCLLYTSPSPRDGLLSRMPSSA